MTYVFPHIPKAGGTSLLKHFEVAGLNVLTDYRHWTVKLDAEEAARDLSEYDVVIGHFPVDRYARPDRKNIALVRDPVERAFSAYVFHRDEHVRTGATAELYDRIGMWTARGELSFLEFINIAPGTQFVYQRLMRGWARERFALVGTTERYGEFLDGLSGLFGRKFENTIQERKRADDLVLTDEDRRRARNLLAAEYKWYNEFVRQG